MTPADWPAALAPFVLDLALEPAEASLLWRAPALAGALAGRKPGRSALTVVWSDAADRTLMQAGALAAERRSGRRLLRCAETLRPGGAPPSELPETPLGVARLEGRVRSMAGVGALDEMRLTEGTLQAEGGQRVVCRLTLRGAAVETFRTAAALSETLRLSLPRLTLAGEAAELAGAVLPPAHLGAPRLPADGPAEVGLVLLVTQLGGLIRHWAARVDAADPEPVHQMRVATRRLRSGLRLFQAAACCPQLDVAQAGLRDLAALLGAARDWDVFASGLGRQVAAAFAQERAVAAMLRAARRRRLAAYGTLETALRGPAFRALCLLLEELAVTRPWEGGAAPVLGGDLPGFGRAALDRLFRGVRHAGRHFGQRSNEELHALRIRCKRLRYGCELFLPCFAGHAATRFVRRLAALQEALGTLNDGASAEALMRQVGRGLAAGLVRGFAAAREVESREAAGRAWKRFRGCEAFW